MKGGVETFAKSGLETGRSRDPHLNCMLVTDDPLPLRENWRGQNQGACLALDLQT